MSIVDGNLIENFSPFSHLRIFLPDFLQGASNVILDRDQDFSTPRQKNEHLSEGMAL